MSAACCTVSLQDRMARVVVNCQFAGGRLLQVDTGEAERVVGGALPPLASFAEEASPEVRDRIFDEFNSLAVIFRAPAASFTAQDRRCVGSGGLHDEDLLQAAVRPTLC